MLDLKNTRINPIIIHVINIEGWLMYKDFKENISLEIIFIYLSLVFFLTKTNKKINI